MNWLNVLVGSFGLCLSISKIAIIPLSINAGCFKFHPEL